MLNGGFEFDGRVITPVDEKEITDVIKKIQENGVEHVAISGKSFWEPYNEFITLLCPEALFVVFYLDLLRI